MGERRFTRVGIVAVEVEVDLIGDGVIFFDDVLQRRERAVDIGDVLGRADVGIRGGVVGDDGLGRALCVVFGNEGHQVRAGAVELPPVEARAYLAGSAER